MRWLVRWYDENGEQQKKSFELKKGNDPGFHADAYDSQVRDQLNKGTFVNPRSDVTVRELSEKWVKGLATWDMEARAKVLGRINGKLLPFLGNLTVQGVAKDVDIIHGWFTYLEEQGIGPTTVRNYSDILASMLRLAELTSVIPMSPFRTKLVKLPRIDHKIAIPYTQGQLTGIRIYLPERYQELPDIGCGLGLRIGEILGFSPERDISGNDIIVARQVKRIHGVLCFDLPKFRKTRMVPLASRTRKLIDSLPTHSVTLPWGSPKGRKMTVNVIFVTAAGNPHKDVIRTAWIRAMGKAGIPRVPYEDLFHKLRHTYASRLLARGVDIKSVSQYLGHSDPGFTLRTYIHLMANAGDRARQVIDGDDWTKF